MENNLKNNISSNIEKDKKRQIGRKRKKRDKENSAKKRKKELENVFDYKKVLKYFSYLMTLDLEDERITKGKPAIGMFY